MKSNGTYVLNKLLILVGLAGTHSWVKIMVILHLP